MWGDGTRGLAESCASCTADGGACPPVCGDGSCNGAESCGSCPNDCQCGGSGCEETDSPGCGGCSCENCVCEMDDFCCDTAWDGICVDECTNDCNGCDPIPSAQ